MVSAVGSVAANATAIAAALVTAAAAGLAAAAVAAVAVAAAGVLSGAFADARSGCYLLALFQLLLQARRLALLLPLLQVICRWSVQVTPLDVY